MNIKPFFKRSRHRTKHIVSIKLFFLIFSSNNKLIRPLFLRSCFNTRGNSLSSKRFWSFFQSDICMRLSSTMRMIYRIHINTKHFPFSSFPSHSSCFSYNNIFMILITNLTYSSPTCIVELSYLSGRHLNKHQSQLFILTINSSKQSGRLYQFTFTKRSEFYVVYLHSFWNIFQLFSITRTNRRISTIHNRISNSNTFPSKHITFFSVHIMQKRYSRSSIWIILYRSNLCRNSYLIISLKINQSI